jgi:hypothetical protein
VIHIDTSIDIDAPPAVVWAQLIDLASYPEWNPNVTVAEGDLREGATLDIRIERAGAKPREMTVTVTEVEDQRRLEWVGSVGFGWLFQGRHSFELEPLEGGGTRLHNREEVSGLLASFVVTDEPERDYEATNEALKSRVETARGHPESSPRSS